jgi:dihydrofolate reductase
MACLLDYTVSMKVLLYMAMSANGLIAGEDNNEDFISHYNWLALCQLAGEYKNLVWGRKTYELVSGWGKSYFTEDIQKADKVIITSDKDLEVAPGYRVVGSPQEAIDSLQTAGCTTIVLTGGSLINSSFATLGLIDEVHINLEAVMIGWGIPLFSADNFRLNMKLLSIERFEQNGVTLHYQVVK